MLQKHLLANIIQRRMRTDLVLFEYPVNPEHMVEHLIEEYKRHVQLFLVEDLEPGLGVIPQFLAANWDVVLGEPVAVQDGAVQG